MMASQLLVRLTAPTTAQCRGRVGNSCSACRGGGPGNTQCLAGGWRAASPRGAGGSGQARRAHAGAPGRGRRAARVPDRLLPVGGRGPSVGMCPVPWASLRARAVDHRGGVDVGQGAGERGGRLRGRGMDGRVVRSWCIGLLITHRRHASRTANRRKS